MQRHLMILLAILLAGCGTSSRDDDDSAPTPWADDDDDSAIGPAQVESTAPADGAAAAPTNGVLRVVWTSPVSGAELELRAGGVALGGSASTLADGAVLAFTPAEPLAQGTLHEALVLWDGGEHSWSFTTAGSAEDPVDPLGLRGRTWYLDLAHSTVLQPAALAAAITSYLDQVTLLFTFTDASDFRGVAQPGLDVLGSLGVGSPGSLLQDPCVESMHFSAGSDAIPGTEDDLPGSWEDPEMRFRASSLTVVQNGVGFSFANLLVVGEFDDTSPDMQRGTMQALYDTGGLSQAVHGDPAALCETTLAGSCVACEDSAPVALCVPVLLDDVAGLHQPGLVLQHRGCADVIGYFDATGSCAAEAARWDADADGAYEGCPSYTP